MTYWGAVWQNAIGCTLGSLAAIGVTIVIYLCTTKGSREEKEREKSRNEREAFDLFVLLVRNVCQASAILIENIHQFSQDLLNATDDFPELKYAPLNDFKRLSELQDLQKFLFSYTSRFPQGQTAVKDFVEIMAKTDYLQAQFTAIPLQVEKGATFHHQRQLRIKELIEQSDDTLKNILTPLQGNNPLALRFAPILAPYAVQRKQQPQAPLSFHITEFVDRVYNELVQLQNQGGLTEIQQNLKSMTSEAQGIYSQIPQHNSSLAGDIAKTLVGIRKAAEDLKGLVDRMK